MASPSTALAASTSSVEDHNVEPATEALMVISELRSDGHISNSDAQLLVEQALDNNPAIMSAVHVYLKTKDLVNFKFAVEYIVAQQAGASSRADTDSSPPPPRASPTPAALSTPVAAVPPVAATPPTAPTTTRLQQAAAVPSAHEVADSMVTPQAMAAGRAVAAAAVAHVQATGAGGGAGAGAGVSAGLVASRTRGQSIHDLSKLMDVPTEDTEEGADWVDEDVQPGDVMVLYFAREMEHIAIEVQQLCPRRVMLQSVEWGHFKDGFPNLFLRNVRHLWRHDTAFLTSMHDPTVLFEQLSVMYALPRYMCKTFKVLIPWYPTGTMERITKIGQVATANSLARMLSAIPHSTSGSTQLVILDVHALATRFFFSDNVHVRLSTCTYMLLRKLQARKDADKITVAFPDDGAHKRFAKVFSASFPTVTCVKVRLKDKRIVNIKDGEPEGRHVVIVDDLVQSGGTLIECAKALRDRGATKISAYVTHAVFPGEAWRKFTDPADKLITKFWVCDTVPSVTDVLRGRDPFEVLSIAPVVARLLSEGTPNATTLLADSKKKDKGKKATN